MQKHDISFFPNPIPHFTPCPLELSGGRNLPLRNGTPLKECNTSSVVSDGFHKEQMRHVFVGAVQHNSVHLQMM